ncbi:zona pellucida-like domain-containing protein 1 [Thalassophryne amazonica]|uniref:zona pellucida-like domain-containing protein 1 n=1 Tax=Thalassophryne amazonica TaxID=390379 RepID=UPI0014718232|nr:zona pellucida-like domain-containing protein 1 [Thalassophryne amazonica]
MTRTESDSLCVLISHSSSLTVLSLVIQLGLILQTQAQQPNPCISHSTFRPPEDSDITVLCGTQSVDLSIFICPMYEARYNESLMVLNNQKNNSDCFGTADFTKNPPVLRFSFRLNASSITQCNHQFKITTENGTGQFSEFSNVQFVTISGTVNSIDLSAGVITYRPQVLYKYACRYPLQYLLNNTELSVAGVNLAINENNGSFISTLRMRLYEDEAYTKLLNIPQDGLKLKTKVYVAVVATNLTNRFNVLLDRCYATTSPYPTVDKYYDLFVGCDHDAQTKVELNGKSQVAQFSFETFRFVEHKGQKVSTFYLHCTTRLCEVEKCKELLPTCNITLGRRKRAVRGGDSTTNTTVSVSSSPILVNDLTSDDNPTSAQRQDTLGQNEYTGPVVAVIICIVILFIIVCSVVACLWLYVRLRKPILQ